MITSIIIQLVAEWGKSAYDINNGECDEFAMEVIERMGGYQTGITEQSEPLESKYGGHVWIVWNNHHYDAECPNGVQNFEQLPIFVNRESNG